MGDLIHESTAPLARDHDGNVFPLPPGTISWKVRRYTGKPGRPPVVWGDDGIVYLGLEARIADLRRAVNNKPGSYRLYPINKFDTELEPVAVIELVAIESESSAMTVIGDDGLAQQGHGPDHDDERASVPTVISLRFFDLYERMLTSRDAHDELMTRMLTTLVTSTAGIQQSTAELLNTASTTIKVANGVEALNRAEAPRNDIEDVSDKLAMVGQLKQTLAALGDGGKAEMPWFVQLLNGPMGMGLMTIASQLGQTIAAAQRAPVQTAPAKAAAQTATPSTPTQENSNDDHPTAQ